MFSIGSSKQNIFTGIDITPYYVRMTIGEKKSNNIVEILGGVEEPIQNETGEINMEATHASLKRCAERLKNQANSPLGSIIYAVSGEYYTGIENNGIVRVKNKVVTNDDIKAAFNTAEAIPLKEGDEILMMLPQDYIVDFNENYLDPRGAHGVRLEVLVYAFVCSKDYKKYLERNLSKCGLKPSLAVPEGIAASEAVLNVGEKEIGVALVNIQARGMEIVVWKNRAPIFTHFIPLGANYITKDISQWLRIPFKEAQKLKEEQGIALASAVSEDETIEIWNSQEQDKRAYPKNIFANLIEARVEEMFEKVKQVLEESKMIKEIARGIVITGEGSKLEMIDAVARNQVETEVRIGRPNDQNRIEGALFDRVKSQSFSTSVGLVLFGARGILDGYYQPEGQGSRFWRFFDIF